MQKSVLFLGSFLLFAFAVGCGGVREESIQVKNADDPLATPRSILERYSQGQALGSEVAGFPKLVEDVKKTDPARGEVLAKGFEEIQKAAPPARAGIAKDVLAKIK